MTRNIVILYSHASHYFDSGNGALCPVSTAANVENNERRILKKNFGSLSSRIVVSSSLSLVT